MIERNDIDWRIASVEYKEAMQQFDESKERLQIAKDAIESLTDEDCRGFGVEIKFTERRGCIDYKKIFDFVKPEVDIENFRKKSSSVVTINVESE